METQAQPEGTRQTGAGILALSLTLLVSALCSQESPLTLFFPSFFSSLLPSSFFCFFFIFFTPYFFLPPPFLHFCFVFGLSVSSFLSPPPLLLKSSFLRNPGLAWGEPGGGVLLFSTRSSRGRNLPRKGSCGASRGLWIWAWCAAEQTRPRLRSRPDGGGLAFLLRGSATAA